MASRPRAATAAALLEHADKPKRTMSFSWRRNRNDRGHDRPRTNTFSGTPTMTASAPAPPCFVFSLDDPGPPPQPVPEEMLRTLARKLAKGLISREEYNSVREPPSSSTFAHLFSLVFLALFT
jgi:hypothetical protein